MTRMQKAGKAKFEARKAKWEGRAKARQDSLQRRVGTEALDKLERLYRKAGAHGAATKERLLEFVAFRFGDQAERAEFVLWEVAKHALRHADPLAELNRQLNEEEAKPVIDKSWTEVQAGAVVAPEGGK
jgi:signal-transduction protein with cAMP-binding, CBS, and nucleotidyltransferase domain